MIPINLILAYCANLKRNSPLFWYFTVRGGYIKSLNKLRYFLWAYHIQLYGIKWITVVVGCESTLLLQKWWELLPKHTGHFDLFFRVNSKLKNLRNSLKIWFSNTSWDTICGVLFCAWKTFQKKNQFSFFHNLCFFGNSSDAKIIDKIFTKILGNWVSVCCVL